jgi:hypothetical protein
MAAAKLCLKARPTTVQLTDRLQPVDGALADGLELYLAAEDLASAEALDGVVARLAAAELPDGFALLIEGPVDSLDGGDFDVTRESAADRLVVQRLAELAGRIGARAVNIHLIAPSPDVQRLNLACRAALLERSVHCLNEFVDLMDKAGAVPTIENMPPVLRMRRSDFAFTPIGMCSADLVEVAERVPGLRVLVDTSHAGLYLNARGRGKRFSENAFRDAEALENAFHDELVGLGGPAAWLAPWLGYLRQLPAEAPDLAGFVQAFGPHLENAQISNAHGLLGEGLPYADGDFDLDPAIAWLGQHARHIVTETLEASHDDAHHMRDALRRMRAVLA